MNDEIEDLLLDPEDLRNYNKEDVKQCFNN